MTTKTNGLTMITVALAAVRGNAQQVTAADYARAEHYLPANAMKRVCNVVIVPRWTGQGEQFWYERDADGRKQFVLIDPDRNTRIESAERPKLPADPSKGVAPEALSPDGR